MKEINYSHSKKDLAEAKIHHLLSEEMAKPQKHIRKLSYRFVLIIPFAKIKPLTLNLNNLLFFKQHSVMRVQVCGVWLPH